MGIGIEVLPIGPVSVAARVWRNRGKRLLTAIVKATFAMHHEGVMTPIVPIPIATEERHYRNNPVASLMRASDMALLVPKPEMVVVGSAYAAPGQRIESTSVRFALARGDTMLITKRLDVLGDRRARPGDPEPTPQPFEKMPLLYERARGGIASRENPVGTGMATDADGLLTLPNIVVPPKGGASPAGFGPIPSAWPLRQKKRGSLGWAAANQSLDVDVPDDFDDAYFQTAPSDQQLVDIRSGDLVALVNMHPELATIRTYLPSMRGVALAQTARGNRIPLSLRIDTVHLEPDAMRAEIVFRGATIITEDDLTHVRVAGAIESPETPFSFPDLSTVTGLVMQAGHGALTDLASTAVIEPAGDGRRPAQAPTPGGRAHAGTMIIEEPRPELRQAPRDGRSGTMIIEEPRPAPRVDARPGTMIIEEPPPRPQSLQDRREKTLELSPEASPKSLPFARRARTGKSSPANKAAELPGAPWAGAASPGAGPAREDLGSTVVMDPEPPPRTPAMIEEETTPSADAPADEVTTTFAIDPATVPPIEDDPKPAPKKDGPWRVDPSTQPAATPRVAPRAQVARPAAVKSDLYKKFKK